VLLHAEALAGQKLPAEAERVLLEARTKTPNQFEFWAALSGLAAREQQWDRAEQRLDEAEEKFGDQVWLRLARGSYLLARYKQDAGPKLKPLAENAQRFSATELFNLNRRLAAMMFEAGDLAEAKILSRRACDADRKNIEARVFLLDLALLGEDKAGVEQALDEIRKLEGEGPFWHYGQAALCVVTKPVTAALDEAAFQHLAAARKLRPGWAQVLLLTAQIQDRQGQGDAALQNYLQAIDLGERSPRAIRRAVELLYVKQRYSDADRLLRDLEQQSSLFTGDVGRVASEVSARLENLDRALEIAQKVATGSKNWRDHLWLGQLQGLVGLRAKSEGKADEAQRQLDDAKRSLQLANQLKPEAPETWLSLVRFYMEIDRKSEAEALVHQAEKTLPEKTAGLALAACYEALGNDEQAAKLYQAAIKESPQDPLVVRSVAEDDLRKGRAAEAEAHLRTLISPQLGAKPDDVSWGRRTLAAVLRSSRRYPKIEEALALIKQNPTAASSPDDLKERAFALALCPQLERRQEAIRILEGLLTTQPNAADVRMTLAQLYLGQKDWTQASKHLRSLMSSHDRDPRYVAVYVARLLDRHETAEAELWLNRLEQLAPRDVSTATLRAQSFAQRGQIDSAIRAIGDYLKTVPASARAAQIRLAAASLEALARDRTGSPAEPPEPQLLAEAEALYRRYVKEQPGQQLVLATFLARCGRYDEALTAADPAAPAAELASLAEASIEMFGSGSAGASQGQRLEKLLLAALEKHEHAAPLLLALAALRMRQDRFDDAILIYREALEKDPSNLVAMNNLALLLALQKKQPEESLKLIEKAIAVAGPLPALLDTRASAYLAAGQPEKALADLAEAIKDEPRPNREFHLALARSQLGQLPEAADALGAARKLGLKLDDLNSLERSAYRELVAKLGR
jgi:tetratricopeptide (TPR) repeat protein